MRIKVLFTLSFCLIINLSQAQNKKLDVVIGYGLPDLVHIGFNLQLSEVNKIGLNFGNSFNHSRKSSITLDHKLAILKNTNAASLSTWFIGQRFTYTHLYQMNSKWKVLYFTPALGRTFSVNKNMGFNLDAGIFLWLWKKETKIINGNTCNCDEHKREYDVLPSARLQIFYRIN